VSSFSKFVKMGLCEWNNFQFMGCLDAFWMKVQGKVQQNGAILLVKSHKLDPRPIDEDSKPVQVSLETK
jgi:hypothetical protein